MCGKGRNTALTRADLKGVNSERELEFLQQPVDDAGP